MSALTQDDSPRSRRRLHPAAGLALFLLSILIVPAAQAHAVYQSSNPPADAQVPAGITRVTVTLTEDVVLDYSKLEVATLQGQDVTAGPTTLAANSKSTLQIDTQPLQDGVYAVTWSALSSDTHATRGTFLFAVGNATLTYRSGSTTETQEPPGGTTLDGFARAGYYAGLLGVLGASFFLLVVSREPPTKALRLTLLLLGLAGGACGLVVLNDLAGRAGATLASMATTSVGRDVALRASLLALAGAAVLLPRRAGPIAGLALSAGALVFTSLASHAASVSSQRELAILTDALHLLMGAIWVGGVLAFLFHIPSRSAEELPHLIRRFSPYAMASVALLLLTGTLASLRFIPAWSDLWSTTYGRLVSAKILLLLVLAGFGALNQRVLAPRLAREGDAKRHFRVSLALEAGFMALVLLAAGGLTAASPPQKENAIDSTPLIFERSNSTKITHVVLQIQPNPVVVGTQRIYIQLHPLTSAPIPNSTLVQAKIWGPNETEPDVTIDPARTSPIEWQLKGGYFTSAGTWHLKVLFQRPDEGYKTMTFDVPVELPGATPTGAPT